MNTEVIAQSKRPAEVATLESEQRYKRLLAAVTDYVYAGHGRGWPRGGDIPRSGLRGGDRIYFAMSSRPTRHFGIG